MVQSRWVAFISMRVDHDLDSFHSASVGCSAELAISHRTDLSAVDEDRRIAYSMGGSSGADDPQRDPAKRAVLAASTTKGLVPVPSC